MVPASRDPAEPQPAFGDPVPNPAGPTMDGPGYTLDACMAHSMAAELLTEPPDADAVACSDCKTTIPDPDPVVHCATCGWQEKRGAD